MEHHKVGYGEARSCDSKRTRNPKRTKGKLQGSSGREKLGGKDYDAHTPSNRILTAQAMEDIISALFPTHPVRKEACNENAPSEIPLFSEKELLDAAKTLRNRHLP